MDDVKKQSFLNSGLEALTQNIVGLIIGFIILTLYGLSVTQSLWLQSVFFITSLIRGFLIRRFFNRFS